MQYLSKIKKISLVLISLLLIAGCSSEKKKTSPQEKYSDMIDLVKSYDDYSTTSDYFEVSSEETKLADGSYRYYIVIEKAKIAMYDVEAIAIESGVDYSEHMAANVGIFEESTYSMIPNQANTDKGYVSGLVISGLTSKPKTSLLMLVQWKSKDLLNTTRQYIKVDVEYKSDYVDENELDNSNDFSQQEEQIVDENTEINGGENNGEESN